MLPAKLGLDVLRGALLLLIGSLGCSSGASNERSKDIDAGPPPVRALFDLQSAPMRFGAIPWPDDGYLDETERVSVRAVPSSAAPEYAEGLALAMADLDGFGVRPVIYVRFDGELDPESLPAGEAASLEPEASVFLVDADTSSPSAFERIAVSVTYEPERRELQIRPALPHVLEPGRRYAAVVTRGVRAQDGRAIDGALAFIAIRDSQAALADPLERAARARYAPVLETLAAQGTPRQHVAALAVFRVQNVGQDMSDARQVVRASPVERPSLTAAFTGAALDALLGAPKPSVLGLDSGAPHAHIAWLIQGRFAAPYLAASQTGWHGAFERSAAGELLAKARDEVAFTLCLPLGALEDAPLPVVIVQHGLFGERSDTLPLADALAAAGYAVLAFDAPFHGLRAGGSDTRHRFTEAQEPDGFGDAPGDFIGMADEQGDLQPLHPFYVRDALRQGAVDLLAAVQWVQSAELSGLADLDPALAPVRLDDARVGFVGIDSGAEIGMLAASVEPSLSPLVLAFAGGAPVDGWFESPGARPLGDALLVRLGHDPDHVDFEADSPLLWPDLDVFRTLVDRAGGLAHASALRRSPSHALLLLAVDDEVVDNRGSETLAHALGATLIGSEPRFIADLSSEQLRPGATLSANFVLESGSATRALYAFEPATHETLVRERGEQRFAPPLRPPFSPLAEPREVANPLASAMEQITFYFESLRTCYVTEAQAAAARLSQCAPAVRLPAQ